jgi:transcriptional regulator with XRE-family HTH domain
VVKKGADPPPSDATVSEEMRLLFGRNCKAARIEAGLSQVDVAERTGIPQPRISMIELGKVNITLETMMILARVVDHNVIHLMSPTGKPSK